MKRDRQLYHTGQSVGLTKDFEDMLALAIKGIERRVVWPENKKSDEAGEVGRGQSNFIS